jgi:hypothetical protein
MAFYESKYMHTHMHLQQHYIYCEQAAKEAPKEAAAPAPAPAPEAPPPPPPSTLDKVKGIIDAAQSMGPLVDMMKNFGGKFGKGKSKGKSGDAPAGKKGKSSKKKGPWHQLHFKYYGEDSNAEDANQEGDSEGYYEDGNDNADNEREAAEEDFREGRRRYEAAVVEQDSNNEKYYAPEQGSYSLP